MEPLTIFTTTTNNALIHRGGQRENPWCCNDSHHAACTRITTHMWGKSWISEECFTVKSFPHVFLTESYRTSKSYVNLYLIQRSTSYTLSVMLLSPNTTYLLQPMDLGVTVVFGKLIKETNRQDTANGSSKESPYDEDHSQKRGHTQLSVPALHAHWCQPSPDTVQSLLASRRN
jgi:hypothetical protein